MRNLSTHVWLKLDKLKEREAFVRLGHDGALERVTFADWTRRVQRFAVGLMERGLEAGQRVAMVAPNSAEALGVAMGAWIAGACIVWVSPGDERREILRRLGRAGAEWIVVGDRDALDHVRGQAGSLPASLSWLVLDGASVAKEQGVVTLEVLEEEGRKRAVRGGVELLQKRAFGVKPEQPSLILFDPDELEDPHGAFFSGAKVARMLDALGEDLLLGDDERFVSLLGYGWFHAFLFNMAGLLAGVAICDAPSVRQLSGALGALSPTRIIAGPAFLERQAAAWQERVEQVPELLREAGEGGSRFSLSGALGRISEHAQRAFFQPVRKDVGASLRAIYVVGGKLPAEAFDVLERVGIGALGVWGLPECGVSHLERLGATRRDSVGRPVQGYACKIERVKEGASGQILVKSGELFDGYWDDAGPRAIEDGWLQTGLEGIVREGFLFVGAGDE